MTRIRKPSSKHAAWCAPAGWIVLGAVLPLGAWMALAPLSMAVVAPAFVKVDLNRRPVQHLEGGIVRSVMVRDGQRVTAGEPVLILGDVGVDADRNRLTYRAQVERAGIARLDAEQMRAATLALPAGARRRRQARRAACRKRSPRSSRCSAPGTTRSRARPACSRRSASASGRRSWRCATRSRRCRPRSTCRRASSSSSASCSRTASSRPGAWCSSRRSSPTTPPSWRSAARSWRAPGSAWATSTCASKALVNEYVKSASDQLKAAAARLGEIEQELRKSEDAAARQVVTAPAAGEVIDLKFNQDPTLIRLELGGDLRDRAGNQHVAVSHVDDLLRHEVQEESFRAGHALVPDHDQVGIDLTGHGEDLRGGVALTKDDVALGVGTVDRDRIVGDELSRCGMTHEHQGHGCIDRGGEIEALACGSVCRRRTIGCDQDTAIEAVAVAAHDVHRDQQVAGRAVRESIGGWADLGGAATTAHHHEADVALLGEIDEHVGRRTSTVQLALDLLDAGLVGGDHGGVEHLLGAPGRSQTWATISSALPALASSVATSARAAARAVPSVPNRMRLYARGDLLGHRTLPRPRPRRHASRARAGGPPPQDRPYPAGHVPALGLHPSGRRGRFLVTHGVSMWALFAVRAVDGDRERILEWCEASKRTTMPMYISFGLLLLGGVAAGIDGALFADWWLLGPCCCCSCSPP